MIVMSLKSDKFFFRALRSSAEIAQFVDGRIFNPARPTIDENQDRIPYIIVMFENLTNTALTKDAIEGYEDTVNISILCVAEDRDSLGELSDAVRSCCREYWEDNDDEERPIDWQFSAGGVQYDPMKPCCFQTLHYQCSTSND